VSGSVFRTLHFALCTLHFVEGTPAMLTAYGLQPKADGGRRKATLRFTIHDSRFMFAPQRSPLTAGGWRLAAGSPLPKPQATHDKRPTSWYTIPNSR